MSKLDEYEDELERLKRLSKDVNVLCAMKSETIQLSAEFQSFGTEPLDLLTEVLQRDETKTLMKDILEKRKLAAKNAAIAECEGFLRKHVVQEVMET